MPKAHGKTREELEHSGADPEVDDTEGSRGEDKWWDLSVRRIRSALRKWRATR
jgi:hypothetical protein